MKNIIVLVAGLLWTYLTLAQQNQVYLFGYFKDNGQDGLHLAYSKDAFKWHALNEDQSVLQPELGADKLMRDPCIIRGADGLFHMVFTISWKERSIGYVSSRDLVNWSAQQIIPVMKDEPGARNCWAPEITYDPGRKEYMIYWSSTITGKYPAATESEDQYNHRIYYITTKDFSSYSPTKLLYDPGFNVIDASIVKDQSRFIMFLKDESLQPKPAKNIKVAYSQHLTGPYSKAGPPVTGDYWAEGPTTVRVDGKWLMYFDKYNEGKYGLLSSPDLKNWTDESGRLDMASGIRHGSILSVTGEELELLQSLLNQKKAGDSIISITGWKFKTGEHPSWLLPGFDDSGWGKMKVPAHWEEEGLPDYDGYAVYRAKVHISSGFKKQDMRGLHFDMGAIDDFDSVFVNGVCIGASTEFRDDRHYYVLYDEPFIKWDAENVIAVKVLDKYGWGGMYRKVPAIRNAGISDFVIVDPHLNQWHIEQDTILSKQISVKAKRNTQIRGKLQVVLEDPSTTGRSLLMAKDILFNKDQPAIIQVKLKLPAQQSYILRYEFTEDGTGGQTVTCEIPPYLLTPAPADKPVINGAAVIDIKPGAPVVYRVPASGQKPLRYHAQRLPAGLKLDAKTGVLSGKVFDRNSYNVIITVSNKQGKDTKVFRINAGERQLSTPPLGWNSWNAWGIQVDDQKVRSAADLMVRSGLADYGWSYINIDDGWQSQRRDQDGNIMSNERFPDMRLLADYIHEKGLKFGLYSSPGPLTCGGFEGSYQHELKDAQIWSKWGADLVKYDLCSYQKLIDSRNEQDVRPPYALMKRYLDQQPRQIAYSFCQYGWGDVWKWARSTGGHIWRTGDDIEDTWSSVASIAFNQQGRETYAGPGGWNDLDMLVIGTVGWGYPRPSRLTPDEQYTHVSLWSMLASPLFIGCDLDKLDPFTRNLLTNPEVIAINQDTLGIQGRQVYEQGDLRIFSKKLSGGVTALSFVNAGSGYKSWDITKKMTGLTDPYHRRDVWRRQDLGVTKGNWHLALPAHGVLLLICK